jgi:hypothetical protein
VHDEELAGNAGGEKSGENRMRKSALVLAIIMIAAAPTAALAAKKAKAPADPNAPAKKFVQEAFMQPVYAMQSAMGQQQQKKKK